MITKVFWGALGATILISFGLFLHYSKNLDFHNSSLSSEEWEKIITAKDIYQAYPQKIHFLFGQINLNHSGLLSVQQALASGDTVIACKRLLEYYQNASTSNWLREKTYQFEKEAEKKMAQQLLQDVVTFGETTAEIPKNADGGWRWTYTGPENDDEFGYSLNGHQYFPLFLKGWQHTKNPDYIKKFDLLIRDWIIHNPLPDESSDIYRVHSTTTEELDWRDIGEVVWRDLEVGQRFGESWPHTFYGFQQQEQFTPAGRLLMLASIPVQAEYLQQYHKRRHNWTTMEMDGLALIGLTFPEFDSASAWVDYGLKIMQEEINGQVYPDGTQTELSTKTQWVALSRFESLVENFRDAGKSVPQSYLDRIEKMYEYMAYAMRPDGHQPLNNDSDREDLRPRVLKAAEAFGRPDWVYIATNGTKGKQPAGMATTVFPWAGIHIMRNGWEENSHWTFFDAGPFGTGHQHSDMLHISIHANGRDILVDGGRFTHKDYFSFDPTIWRGYFRSSFSHNVILVDCKGQNYGPLTAKDPLREGIDYFKEPDFDFAKGTFSSGFVETEGKIEHTRAVFYLRDKFWVVADYIETDRPRKLEVLWHYHPDCQVVIENDVEAVSVDSGLGNLRIIPQGGLKWNIEIIKGKTQPYIQGWYSETYGVKEANPTVVYTANIQESQTFIWTLLPAKGDVPNATTELIDAETGKVKVEIEGESPTVLSIPILQGEPKIL